ncbi:MAG: BON domain-containing protein [Bacteroidia bacterium]|nr:BON domain-containing protein [Bacteroidia bacterium]
MKNNTELQKDVYDAIKWEPLLKTIEIGVIAKDGVVTLTGLVDSYTKKSEAERAAKNVAGVKAVVENIKIQLKSFTNKSGNDIANEILNAFKWSWEIPTDKIKVKVEDGWVTIDGEVKWNFQKEAANKAVNNLIGVKGVTNNIAIKTETHDDIEKKDIERALLRNWSINDKEIAVNVSGSNVTLKGIVHSLYQKDQAGRIAWNAPGVITVNNELIIE